MFRRYSALTLVVLVVAGVAALAARAETPDVDPELRADLQARRAKLMAALDSSTLFIAWSAEPKLYSRDVDYEFRQDSNLLYLTGITQEGTTLVLMPGNATKREILFIADPNPRREHWNGHLLTKQEATAVSGIATVYYTSQFETFVGSMMNRLEFDRKSPADESAEFEAFFSAVAGNTAKLSLVFGPRPDPSEPLTSPFVFASRARDRYIGVSIADATALVEGLRQVKTPWERKVLEKSVQISGEAHKAGMRTAAPGRYEYEVEAAIERVYLANGALSPGYPSIVASGPNATVLHYQASTRKMEAGDLLLVDAAANYRGLTGDITRTYPVSGTFSPAQKDIYALVLEAQEAGMRAAKAGNRKVDIERAVADVMKTGLLKLGLITDTEGDQYRTWFTHGICHWIGMDVHDAGDDGRKLEPGMAFVIEPGLYVREAALETLPDTPESREFREKVKAAVQKYKDIGIRVEDSFLLSDTGLVCLSSGVPRTIEEVETFLKGGTGPTR